MKPKQFDLELLSKEDLVEGNSYKILDEFNLPALRNAKFQGFLMGLVELVDGNKKLLGINKTSYRELADVFGEDTKNWIGKSVVYAGTRKMGAMQGKLFVPKI